MNAEVRCESVEGTAHSVCVTVYGVLFAMNGYACTVRFVCTNAASPYVHVACGNMAWAGPCCGVFVTQMPPGDATAVFVYSTAFVSCIAFAGNHNRDHLRKMVRYLRDHSTMEPLRAAEDNCPWPWQHRTCDNTFLWAPDASVGGRCAESDGTQAVIGAYVVPDPL